MANFLDKILDGAEKVVGGMERGAAYAGSDRIPEDSEDDIIDAEFTEVKTPIETPANKAKDIRNRPSSTDRDDRISFLRLELYSALGTLKGDEKTEFKKLIKEISQCLELV